MNPSIRILKIFLIALLSFIALIFQPAYSQLLSDYNGIKSWQLKSYAKSAQRNGDIYSAIEYYEAYTERFPNDLKVAREMAELYLAARDYENAAFMFLKTYHLNIDRYKQSLFYYALMEKMQGNYERAIRNFEKFLKEYRDEKDTRQFRKWANLEIEGCNLALDLYNKVSRQKIIVSHLNSSINTAHIELSPVYLDDNTMMYSALKAESIELFPVNDTSVWPVRQFYKAEKRDSTWYGVGKLEGPFNAEGINVGNAALSPDSTRMYFNRCTKNWQGKMICDLYVSNKAEKDWLDAMKLPEPVNMANYTSTQPTVGRTWKKNKEIIYFVSDRPEGKGGFDIWYTFYDTVEHVFSEPKALSRKVNTEYDEFTPFYDNESKTLYYSSTGKPGVGGFDIFKTEGADSKFNDAINLGYPYNSPADDLYFVMNKNEKEGFFVSNRLGGTSLKNETCCDDIYAFDIPNYISYTVEGILLEDVDNILQQYIKKQGFSVKKDHTDSPPLEGIDVSLYVIDKTTMESLLVKKIKTDKNGYYNLKLLQDKNYKLILNEDGVFNREFEFDTYNPELTEIKLDTTSLINMPDQPLVIKNIYYEFDRSALTDIAKSTIDSTLLQILNEIPEIIVEISSHTDNKGNDSYNMRLSQSRAESVVNYLVEEGISRDRLIAKGYGETRPLVSNTFPDGSDNPEGREQNRRTEFRIIGRISEVEGENK